MFSLQSTVCSQTGTQQDQSRVIFVSKDKTTTLLINQSINQQCLSSG